MICGKKIFPTRELAVEAVNGLQAVKGKGSKTNKQPGYVYLCREGCNGWHMATAGKKRTITHIQRPSSLSERKPKQFGELKIYNPCRVKI